MPFTPYHFGAHACTSLPFCKRLDVFTFLLANVVIDIEPLLVMILGLDYPLHGYFHTFLGGGFVGFIWALTVFVFRNRVARIMKVAHIPYNPQLKIVIISGIFGAWLHVLFDSPLYYDMRPFFPVNSNPFLGMVSAQDMYTMCTYLFIPAILIYLVVVFSYKKKDIQ